MMLRLTHFFFCWLLVFSCSVVVQAQKTKPKHGQKRVNLALISNLDDLPKGRRERLLWTQASWSVSDAAYTSARKAIDAQAADGADLRSLVAKYRGIALKNNNALSAFQWGYAAWLVRKKSLNSFERDSVTTAPKGQMLGVRFPNNYQYARLLFLVQAVAGEQALILIPAGKRLLKYDKQDQDVRYQLAGLQSISGSAAGQKEALLAIQNLIRENPTQANLHATLGAIHYLNWKQTKESSDAAKAKAAYRRYLQIANPNDDWRSQAQRLIETLEAKAGV
jgi:hypothetical protein